MTVQWPVPKLPSDRLIAFDYFKVEPEDGDLHAGWARCHRGPDIFYTPLNGGHWVATRAEDIFDVFRDPERFSNHGVAMIREQHGPLFIPGQIDPPLHTAFRTVLNPELSPKRVKTLEDRSRELICALLDEIAPTGGCEFHEAVAERIPIYSFLNFMNLPIEDAALLLPDVAVIGRSSDMEAFAGSLASIRAYVDARIEERLRVRADDFIGRLVHAQVDGRPIERDEMLVTTLNVMLGGLDTVTASMGFFMNFLARNPGHRHQLTKDPGLIPEAVEELLRRHGIFNTGRLVTRDIDFKGQHLRKDDLILVPTALHNLDERRFPNPLEVDFHRKDKNHLTFGVGIHRCLGSNFARMQLRILLEEWLNRIPEFGISAGGTTTFQSGRANAVMHLPLAW
jgi:cytochrome P450